MKKLLYLFAASLVVFTSCSNDNNDSSDSSDSVSSILPKKVTYIESDGSSHSEDIVFNGNKVVSITGEDYVMKYTYVGDFITKFEEFDENNVLYVTKEYTYTNGKLTSLIKKETGAPTYSNIKFVHNADGTVSYEDFMINSSTNAEDDGGFVGTFTFKDGNLVKNEYTYYGSEKLITYEYDINNNPLKNILGFNLLLDIDPSESYVNNVTKIINTSDTSVRTTTYTYKYDANNYPTEGIATYTIGASTAIKTTQFVY